MTDAAESNNYLSIGESQEVELGLLKQIHSYCERHHLRYNLAFGTLLGAVRHQGFIPWDNDVDIMMPRPDYERMISLASIEPIGDHAYLLHWSNDERYHYPIVRVCDDRTCVIPGYIREQPRRMGVWVDIFPVDGVWEHPLAHIPSLVEMRILKVLQRADNYAPEGSSGMKRVAKSILARLFPNEGNAFQRKIDEVAMRCPYGSTRFSDTVTEFVTTFPRITANDFDHPVLLEFEGSRFCCPPNWDEVLSWTYGDYMRLPPESERMTHDIHARWVSDGGERDSAGELGSVHED